MFRRHQSHVMSARRADAPDMMRAATAFHRNDAGESFPAIAINVYRLTRCRNATFPEASSQTRLQTFLRMSRPSTEIAVRFPPGAE
jgi:hypothetical protein